MTTITKLMVAILVAGASLLSGCAAVSQPDSSTLYDLGPLHAGQTAIPNVDLPPISIAEVSVPAGLDSTMMFYRLNYANQQQPRPYAQARWVTTPSELLSQQLKARITQAGGVALSRSDGAANVPVLRVEATDFTQSFSAPDQSTAQVGLRASVFKDRSLVAQKTFVRQVPAPTPDAAGGAKALANASDAAIADLISWLSTLGLK